jgi:uncharacterized repeat protein (TIGR03943 family)
MRRDAQGVVLLLLGAVLFKIGGSTAAARYVRPGLAPVLVVAGIAVLLVGAMTLRQVARDHRRAADPEQPHPEELSTRDGRWGWVVVAAALLAVLGAPPAPGADKASRTAVLLVGPSTAAPLPASDPVRMSLREFVGRAVTGNAESLRGREVTLTGFLVVAPGGQHYLARMSLTCCAADARPIEVGLVGNLPEAVLPDEWLEVDGGFVDLRDRDTVSGAVIPYLAVTAVRPIATPSRPYE